MIGSSSACSSAETNLSNLKGYEILESIHALVDIIQKDERCTLQPPCEIETLQASHLPADLKAFYALANGAELFTQSEYHWRIIPFDSLITYEQVFDPFNCDGTIISASWIIFLEEISHKTPYAIDLHEKRFGSCYQVSRYDYPDILALSFSEMVQMVLELQGNYPPWYANGYRYYGDPCSPRLEK
jgi:SMI1 / KNR4 family (SUKH-1)